MKPLQGFSAFPITPSDDEGRVDTTALRLLVARLRDAQVDSIGLLGSTGSYPYLTRKERLRALEATLEEVGTRIPVIVGVGALRTDAAINLAQDARAAGAAGGLLAAVSYTKLTDDEVFDHYNAVARESGLPICIYDNPGGTHFSFTPDLIARLANTSGFIAVKSDAVTPSETASHIAALEGLVPKNFSLGYSNDWNATEALIAGADTWYCVLGGLLPEVCGRIVKAVQGRDFQEARRLDRELAPIWDLFKEYSSLRVVYALAEQLGLNRSSPPRPVKELSISAKERVREVLALLPNDLTR